MAKKAKQKREKVIEWVRADGETSTMWRYEPNEIDIVKEISNRIVKHRPTYPKPPRMRQPVGESSLMVVSPTDVHFGKPAYRSGTLTYDNETARRRCLEGVRRLWQKVWGVNIEKILLIGGNDIVHTDRSGVTTKGTQVETIGTQNEAVDSAHMMYTELIDQLRQIAPVHYSHTVSNHDHYTGGMIAKILEMQYRRVSRVTVDSGEIHRKYFQYGRSLIGTTHGHQTNAKKLPELMSGEAADMWDKNQIRYFYCGHLHHKRVFTSANGVIVEHLLSVSDADDWHKMMGYLAPAGLEIFIHGKDTGSRMAFTHFF